MKTKTELLIQTKRTREILHDIREVSSILKQEEQGSLQNYDEKFQDWEDRLSDDRYRVAIIGTEKAGKSTFANALLRRDFLPEDEGRCTFTTTTIESSKTEDIAEIEFFTKQEFINKFDELCEEVEFKCTYGSVTIEQLDSFCETTSSAIATSNAVDDLRDIIGKKSAIESYLSGRVEVFKSQEIDQIKSYITDEIKARAVKNITIKSTQFKEQENLIIYDVPGFDSPTKLHLEQAKWYMRNADVVIMLVSVADRISFVKAQADFLNDTKDKYGNKLSDKLIIVASKFDKHIVDDKNSSDIKIEKSYKILVDELKKYGLYKEKNLFKASSLGFLEKEQIVSTQYAYPNLVKHNYSDGIESIEQRLQEFLDGEALQILNENFTIDNSDVENFFLHFKHDYNPKKDARKQREAEFELVDTRWDGIQKELKSQLKKYDKEMKQATFEFDGTIASQIETEWIEEFKTSLQEDLDEVITNIVGGRADITQASKINEQLRETIYKRSLDKIVGISTTVITQENNSQASNMLEIISQVVFANQSLTTDEKEELQEIFEHITVDFCYDAKSYRPLILRFLNNVFEILILNRISNNEEDARVKRFKHLRSDVEALLNYDEAYNDEFGFYNQNFIKKLLIQDVTYSPKQPTLAGLLKGVKIATNEEEVILEITNDLNALKEIFNTILLKAVSIESPFKASLNDQIQALLNDINENSQSKIKRYVVSNIESIAKEEYTKLSIDENLAASLNNIIQKIG